MEQAQSSNIKSGFIRKKSEDQLTFEIFQNKRKLKHYLRQQKHQEIQEGITDLQKKSQGIVNYFTILLGEIQDVIDQIINLKENQILNINLIKNIILKFEKARSHFLYKIQANEKQQIIPLDNIRSLEQIFNQLRYILTRFGRVINFTDALLQGFKRKQITQSHSFKLQEPMIKRIMEQESIYGSDRSDSNLKIPIIQQLQSPSSHSSISSSNKNSSSTSAALDPKIQKELHLSFSKLNSIQNQRSSSQKQSSYDKEINAPANNKQKIAEMLDELNTHEKVLLIEKSMTNIANRWRDEYELCSENFYADKEKEHSKVCIEKITKEKEFTPLNQVHILFLTSLFLEILRYLQQIDRMHASCAKDECFVNTFHLQVSRNTPRLASTNLLQTPTLQRRIITQQDSFNIDNSIKESTNQPSPLKSIELVKSKFSKNKSINHQESIKFSDSYSSNSDLDFKDEQEEDKSQIQSTINDTKIGDQQDIQQIPDVKQEEKKEEAKKVKKDFMIPTLNLSKLGHNQSLPVAPAKNPLQTLQLISGAAKFNNQNPNETPQSSQGQLSIRTMASNAGLPSAKNNNTNIRALESARTIKNFETIKTQSSFVLPKNISDLPTQPTLQQNVSETVKEPEGKQIELIEGFKDEKSEKSEKKVQQQLNKIEQAAKNKKVLKPQHSFDTKIPEEEKKPKINYFATLTSIRNFEEKKQDNQFVISSRDNQQETGIKKQEELKKPQSKPKVTPTQPKGKKESLSIAQAQLQAVNLPKSPYLQAVRRTFNAHQDSEKKKSNLKLDDSQKHHMTSPYINLNKGLSKEQRKEHLKRLKQHVDNQINKVSVNPKDQKSSKFIPISNAFTVTLKNERQEVLKNMENLRKSVKLKKRANPLEKILTKLIISENDEPFTPQFIINISTDQNHQDTIKTIEPVKHNSSMNFSAATLNSAHNLVKNNQLQAIDEIVDEENQPSNKHYQPNTKNHQTNQTSQQEQDSIDKKVQDISKLSKAKQFSGMSPLITFRPLNKFNGDQLTQSTPLTTPQLQPRGAITSRDIVQQANSVDPQSIKNDKFFQLGFERKDSHHSSMQQLQLLQTAKKELDILENLKSISIDIFNMVIQIKSPKIKRQILQKYYDQLTHIKLYENNITPKTIGIIDQFIETIQEKNRGLEQMEKIYQDYYKTLPRKPQQQLIQEESLHKNLLKRKMNTSVQGRDINNGCSPKKMSKKISGIVLKNTYQGDSPTKLNSNYTNYDEDSYYNFISKNDGINKMHKALKEGMMFSDISSPLSFPSDSPFITSKRNNDKMFIGEQKMSSQKVSATPLIQSRNIQNLFRNEIQQSLLKNTSQINSPIIKESINQQFFGKLQQNDLHCIEEEKFKDHANEIINQEMMAENYRPRLPYMGNNEQRKKSQFSNQTNSNLKKRDDMSNNDLSFDKGIQSSVSKESLISDLSKTLKDNQSSSGSSFTLSEKDPMENLQEIDVVIKNHSKESQNSPSKTSDQKSTFSKNKSLKKQQTEEPDLPSTPSHLLDSQTTTRRQIFHQRNYSCNEQSKSSRAPTGKSPRKSQFPKNQFQIKELQRSSSKEDKDEEEKVQRSHKDCQSDIVVGNNYNKEYEQPEEEDAYSDYHEMFFVDELFKDPSKFEKVLEKIREAEEGENRQKLKLSSVETEQQITQSDEEEEVLTMNRVRFNSLCVLPSQIDSCSMEVYDKTSDQVSIQDFILLKTISKGAYGKVILARKKMTQDLFAIKVLDKDKMIEKNVIEYVMNEKNILNKMSNKFIVRGVYTFQSKKYLYMVMEFIMGGDFSSLLQEFGAFDEDTSKIYLAQIVLALEYLHSNGVIHRDLKPDNVLIDSDGHIKLTDFGLSEAGLKSHKDEVQRQTSNTVLEDNSASYRNLEKEKEMQNEIQSLLGCETLQLKDNIEEIKNQKQDVSTKDIGDGGNTTTHVKRVLTNPQAIEDLKLMEEQKQQPRNRILGTAGYMAPEVILGHEHTFALDFWSLGVVAYEFLTGGLPFNEDSPEKVFKRILKRDVQFPTIGRGEDEMSPEAYDFINKLLVLDPKQRLGYKDIMEIKKHPFFRDIDWQSIMKLEPPFKPQGREVDASYFPNANDKDEDLKIIINDQKDMSQEMKEFNKFESISYGTLMSINAKEAKNAIIKAKRALKKNPQPRIRSSMYNETILFDLKSSFSIQDDQLKEQEEEETPRTVRQVKF